MLEDVAWKDQRVKTEPSNDRVSLSYKLKDLHRSGVLSGELEHRPDRFVRYVEVAGNGTETFVLRTDDDLRPAILGNTTPMRAPRVPSGSPSLVRLKQVSGVEEGHQGQCDGVYLAQAIPVASAK